MPINCMIDDPPGMRNYWTAEYHEDFPDDALDVFVKYGSERRSPLAQQLLLPWGGAVARVGEERVRAAFGAEKYAGLQAIKAEYDPANVFHGNQNITPAV